MFVYVGLGLEFRARDDQAFHICGLVMLICIICCTRLENISLNFRKKTIE